MSTRKTQKATPKKAEPAKASEAPKVERKVTFAAWFDKAHAKAGLRRHQRYALQVFFEKHGLTEIEDPEKYDELLKKF